MLGRDLESLSGYHVLVKRTSLRMSWTCLVAMVAALVPPPAAASHDAAFVHAVEPEVGRTLAAGLEQSIAEVLDRSDAPRLMPVEEVRARLLQGRDAERITREAEETIGFVRTRLGGGSGARDMIDSLDGAREDLLRAIAARPRLDLVRDSWALRGLVVHMLGDSEAARRDYARVLESDPSFRPDPRLYPPEAREQMGRALMARTDSHWRVLSSGDVAALGRWLGVDYVVLAHLQDTGLVELSWRVDIFDVVAGRFVGEHEVHFPDAARERESAALEVAELIGEVVPRIARTPRREEVAEARPPPRREPREAPGREVDVREIPRGPDTERRDGPFDTTFDDPRETEKRSGRGWLVAATILALAAGGPATYIGLTADDGVADVQVIFHRRD